MVKCSTTTAASQVARLEIKPQLQLLKIAAGTGLAALWRLGGRFAIAAGEIT